MYRGLLPDNTLIPMMMEESPLTALAQTYPQSVPAIMRSALKTRRIESRIGGLRSISQDQSTVICSWLQNRNPGERNIMVENDSSSQSSGIFGSGERIVARTRVNIW